MMTTRMETDELPGSRGILKWQQDPLWSVECQFLEALPTTEYTPSGMQSCGKNSIGFVWWEGAKCKKINKISVCLNHFLALYDAGGDPVAAGMFVPKRK